MPYDYPVMYSLAGDAGVPVSLLRALCAMPVPLYNDVSLPPRKHTGGQVQSPPGGTGVGRGGGMVSRASGTPIYILIYILRFISLF